MTGVGNFLCSGGAWSPFPHVPGSLILDGPNGGKRPSCRHEGRTSACVRIASSEKAVEFIHYYIPVFTAGLIYNRALRKTRCICPLVPVPAQHTRRKSLVLSYVC